MPNSYSWKEERGDDTYHLPGPDHLGWWAAAAIFASLLLHVLVFFALDHMKIALRFQQAREISTAPVDIRQVHIAPEEPAPRETPENLVVPPVDPASLLEEIDFLDMLPKDVDIDISTETLEPEYALRMQNPALMGDPEAIAMEISSGIDVDAELLQLGREVTDLPAAAVGQLTIDPGAAMADDPELTKFTDDLLRKGADGKARDGALDGLASLDELLGLPPNTLVNKTTMLPSDLLFEFNSAELRESAKLGLMKLGLLIDRNPDLYCWIEGHTDLIGGDSYNLELSKRRAAAVKTYLVQSLRMDEGKIIPRGFGRTRPIILEGDAEAQAPNRRVEIRMRRTTPPKDEPSVQRTPPPRPTVVEEPPPVFVQPQRALPVDEFDVLPPPVAQPVEEALPDVPRARAIDEPPPPPRARPVEP
ncbi:MAG: OmpA family protein [Luteolibacter sp.]|jgi:OmpA-OmpF porin, OOP family